MPLCAFQNPKDGFLRVPLTRALHAGRKQTIRLCFDASRPGGRARPGQSASDDARPSARRRASARRGGPDRPAPRDARRDGDGALCAPRAHRLQRRCSAHARSARIADGRRTANRGDDPASARKSVYGRTGGGRPIPPRSAVYTGPSRRALRRNDAALRLWRPTRLLRYAAPLLGMPRPRRAAGAHRAHALFGVRLDAPRRSVSIAQ